MLPVIRPCSTVHKEGNKQNTGSPKNCGSFNGRIGWLQKSVPKDSHINMSNCTALKTMLTARYKACFGLYWMFPT